LLERIRKAFKYYFPDERREIGWRHGLDTFFQASGKWTWGFVLTLALLGLQGSVDTFAIAREVLTFDMSVIGSIVAGAVFAGILSGISAWRKTGRKPDMLKEFKPRKPRQKKISVT
jgi:hypothetical protein